MVLKGTPLPSLTNSREKDAHNTVRPLPLCYDASTAITNIGMTSI
ncbi:MAG: hypothetical protein ACJ72Q_07220 [Nitrososphaeraceae archaeon]